MGLPKKRKRLSYVRLPHYGKTKFVRVEIRANGQVYKAIRRVHISDETRRLRHIWVRNLLRKRKP